MAGDPRFTVFEDGDFGIFHCADVDVPGYLILTCVGSPATWNQLNSRQMARLGGMIGHTVEALRATVEPERVYVCAFGEQAPALHFHLFPRYEWMADLCGAGLGSIDGPALLSLIRWERACRPHDWSDAPAVLDIVQEVRRRLLERMETQFDGEGDGC